MGFLSGFLKVGFVEKYGLTVVVAGFCNSQKGCSALNIPDKKGPVFGMILHHCENFEPMSRPKSQFIFV